MRFSNCYISRLVQHYRLAYCAEHQRLEAHIANIYIHTLVRSTLAHGIPYGGNSREETRNRTWILLVIQTHFQIMAYGEFNGVVVQCSLRHLVDTRALRGYLVFECLARYLQCLGYHSEQGSAHDKRHYSCRTVAHFSCVVHNQRLEYTFRGQQSSIQRSWVQSKSILEQTRNTNTWFIFLACAQIVQSKD